MKKNSITLGLAQISPIWLDKVGTISKIEDYIVKAGKKGCDLVTFGEALLPGYPFWVSMTNGSEFNSSIQKEIYAHYAVNAIDIESNELDSICKLAVSCGVAVYLGIIERASNRGGHSLYCSLVYINKKGSIESVHRKLQPTYEERLVWSPGDGNGLRVHALENFTVGGLNCWENWMPLSRTALYAQGENLHIAVWPGSVNNTEDITKFIAKESRSFVVSVSGLMSKNDIPKDFPHYNHVISNCPEVLSNGGSCICGPDGNWVLPPIKDKEGLFAATIDFNKVLEERHNFDVAGHYSRPDITKLSLNRERQSIIDIIE